MLRKLFLALALLLAPAVFAQNSTTVTINVTDSGGIAWSGGAYQINFVGPGTASWPGGAITQSFSGTLNGSGSASVSLPSNAVIIPSPTFWNFKVCPNPIVTVSPSGCFSLLNQTISGATQTITATPASISISVPTVASVISPVTAYADAEISGGWVGFSYYNITSPATQRQCTATPCASNFAAMSGGGTGAGTANAGVFNISTACNGAANCLQWVDDDSTDNCGTATTSFMALINAYNGPGSVQVVIGGSGPGKAYKLQTCHLVFNPTSSFVDITLNATLDAGTNSSANLIQFGDGVHGGIYRLTGGHFAGGASLTVAGIEVTNSVGNFVIADVNWLNFGAGNATLGTCTNWAIQVDNFIFEGTIARNYWGANDTTNGRCAFNNVGTTLGESTVFFLDNVIGGASGTHCAGVGILDGGYYGTVAQNNVGNIAVPMLLQGGGHRVYGNQLDTEGCTSGNGINAVIQYGTTGGTNIDAVTIENNVAQFGGSHATNFIQAFHTGNTISNWAIIGNSQSVTTSSGANLLGGSPSCTTSTIGFTGANAFCVEYGNVNLAPSLPCGATNSGWAFMNLVAYCASSTAGANIGSTPLITVPAAGGQHTPIFVTCQILVTTAPTTSGTVPQCVISYTDASTNVAETVIVTPVAAASAVGCTSTPAFNALPPQGYSCQATVGPLFVKTATTVNYSTINYASVGGTAQVDQAFVTAYIN